MNARLSLRLPFGFRLRFTSSGRVTLTKRFGRTTITRRVR